MQSEPQHEEIGEESSETAADAIGQAADAAVDETTESSIEPDATTAVIEPTEDAHEPAADRTLPADLLQRIVEGALLAAGKPLAVEDIAALFEDDERPTPQAIRAALEAISAQCEGRGFELREVSSGFRFQVVQQVAPWIARLWEEKPQKYSRALLETLALIAYRQPITRGDIEDIRGVAVATNIIKTLLERDWVRVVGHKDVPGRPAMYATTRRFLDYFNLKNLDELPALADLRDLDALSAQLSIEGADTMLPEQDGAAGIAQAEAAIEDDGADDAADDDASESPAIEAASSEAAADVESEAAAVHADETGAAAAETEAVATESLEPRTDAHQSED